MDIGQAFGYISEDENWTNKLLVGALITAVPIVNFALFGYQIDITRNVAAGKGRPLPDWNDFGRYWVDGLRLIVAYFVYLLPMFLVIGCLAAALIPFMETSSGTYDPAAGPPPEFFGLFFVFLACTLPYSLFIYALWPLLSIQIARVGSVGACFRLAEMWQLVRAQPANYLILVVVLFGLYVAASFVVLPAYLVILIPCLGYLIFLAIYGAVMLLVFMVVGHLQGQFIRAGQNLEDDSF